MGDCVYIDPSYKGYTFLGSAVGLFKTDRGDMRNYCNLYVCSPVSDFTSEFYKGSGFKAEKKSCLSSSVLGEGFKPGDKVKLFFDDRGRVQLIALDE